MRIDTTLLGFDNMNWQRGSRSYIFKGQGMNYKFKRYIVKTACHKYHETKVEKMIDFFIQITYKQDF